MACNNANTSCAGIGTFEIAFSPASSGHSQTLNVTTSTNTFQRPLQSQTVAAPEDIHLIRTSGGYLARFLRCGECFGFGSFIPFGCYRIIPSGNLSQLNFSTINIHVKTEYNTFVFPVPVSSNQRTYLNLRESAFPVFDTYPTTYPAFKTQHTATVTHHPDGSKTIALNHEA